MKPEAAVDVAVLGAGPAGASVAIRLLALGYRVALIEKRPFPRFHVGEALSPGIWQALSLLGDEAVRAAQNCPLVENLPARVAWEAQEPRLIQADERSPGAMVDRGELDTQLANLAERRGAKLFQPARVQRLEGEPGNWCLQATGLSADPAIRARMIVDARGRRARPPAECSLSGQPTLAAWTHTEAARFPREVRVEAINRAWLWGAPTADGRYRVMAVCDPSHKRRSVGLEEHLRGLMADSGLFALAATLPFSSPVSACAATPYLDSEPWRADKVRVGESALALDPLSSTGLEITLGGAIQAAIAIHTALRDPADTCLARSFYAGRLADAAARHARWAREYYRLAWPGPNNAFWRDRSTHRGGDGQEKASNAGETVGFSMSNDNVIFASLASGLRFGLSNEARILSTPCIVNDRVQIREAIDHRRFDGPVAFLGDIEIVPLLRIVIATLPLTAERLLARWLQVLTKTAAMQLLTWLLRHEVLIPTVNRPVVPRSHEMDG